MEKGLTNQPITNSNCPFCAIDLDREIIFESESTFSIYDKFPVNNGHVLIIPKRHCQSYFELTFQEQMDCLQVLNKSKELVNRKYNPDAFNIGINVGEIAGQTVPHVHIHLIPRFKGDVNDPRGGVRGVIPNKQKY